MVRNNSAPATVTGQGQHRSRTAQSGVPARAPYRPGRCKVDQPEGRSSGSGQHSPGNEAPAATPRRFARRQTGSPLDCSHRNRVFSAMLAWWVVGGSPPVGGCLLLRRWSAGRDGDSVLWLSARVMGESKQVSEVRHHLAAHRASQGYSGHDISRTRLAYPRRVQRDWLSQ